MTGLDDTTPPEPDRSPVEVARPCAAPTGFVFASPHSGQDYPGDFLARSVLPLRLLRRSEDAYVDALYADAPLHGAPLVRARFPRAFVDPNRAATELDPAMFTGGPPPGAWAPSSRASAGLGVIPRLAADGRAIYAGKLDYAEARARLKAYYAPYHAALSHEIERAREAFGSAIVIDCHSMPSASARGADVVLGDRFGASCARGLVAAAEAAFREAGFAVARNRPYAGGFTTEHYGRPEAGVHVLQVEINRGLYMNEGRVEPHGGFDRLKSALSDWMRTLTVGRGGADLQAAE